MKNIIVCTVSEEESSKMQNQMEMLGALESLVRIIAENNDILKEDSNLYLRLVEDYKKNKKAIELFWDFYLDVYKDKMEPNTQLKLDYETGNISIIPNQNNLISVIS